MFDADQLKVVNHGTGPMLVVAGAGSGKTTAVVGRAARLVKAGLSPSAHLMLTFTRKAAEEMRHRIAGQLPGVRPESLQVYTFHSFCWKVLRRSPGLFGCAPGVTLLLDDDIDKIFSGLAKSLGIVSAPDAPTRKKQMKTVTNIQHQYGVLRNEGGSLDDPEAVKQFLLRTLGTAKDILSVFLGLCGAYEEHKSRTNTLDFDDLIGRMVRGMQTEPMLRARLQKQYPFITVDEAQDTNLPQFQLAELLAGANRNMVMVGDDDQAIYAWRGARPQNLRDFETNFGAKIAFLMNNYRSQRRIVEAAGEHISNNIERFDKMPRPIRPEQGKIAVWYLESGSEAAKVMATQVLAEIKRGTPADQIAVLYRTNRAVNPLKRAFTAMRIPHHIVNGMDFVTQAEIQLALAAGRLACNPRDVSAFVRLCDLADGVGDKAIESLVASSKASGLPILGAIAGAKLSARALASLTAIQEGVAHLAALGPLVLGDTLEKLGVRAHFTDKDKDKAVTSRRMGSLSELRKMILGWLAGTPPTPEAQWQEVFDALLLDTKHNDVPEGRVWLSTVHQAKGLEWTHVHVWGMSDGIFPLSNSDEEEERRLSYVAITRAKDACHLWHADEYPDRFDQQFTRSRFIRELPKKHLDIKEIQYA